MGCIMSNPIRPDLPSLPSGIVQLTPISDKSLTDQVLNLLVSSFAGSTTTPPEGLMSWMLDEKANVNDDPCQPLKSEPDKERLDYFRWSMEFMFSWALPHGGCFAMIKENKGTQGEAGRDTRTYRTPTTRKPRENANWKTP